MNKTQYNVKEIGISYDRLHYQRIEQYILQLQKLYLSAINEAATIVEGIVASPAVPFVFENFPKAQRKVDSIINLLNAQMYSHIREMSRQEWLASSFKNDQIVEFMSQATKLSSEQLSRFKSRNMEALKAFQERKINGLGLSDRVWNYSRQLKGELELGIDIALGEGRSAAQLSRDLRQYLHNPDKLFRRVKDKHGILHLSKNAQKYHPRPGVYRSSYKNAMRLTRTEINMAYRVADYEKYQQLDFVTGIEIIRSNRFFNCPVCESKKGKYPKSYRFIGWHPQCRCHAVPVVTTIFH